MMTIVPKEMLSAEVLRQVVLEFVSREGTDYGHADWTLEEKINQVLAQIARGEVVVTYNDLTETCNLVQHDAAARELKRLETLAEQEDD